MRAQAEREHSRDTGHDDDLSYNYLPVQNVGRANVVRGVDTQRPTRRVGDAPGRIISLSSH
jgi:hypothetical protein